MCSKFLGDAVDFSVWALAARRSLSLMKKQVKNPLFPAMSQLRLSPTPQTLSELRPRLVLIFEAEPGAVLVALIVLHLLQQQLGAPSEATLLSAFAIGDKHTAGTAFFHFLSDCEQNIYLN